MVSHRVVREFPDAPTEDAWRRFLSSVRLASHFVSPEWFVEPHSAGSPFAVLAEDEGAVRGVLTGLTNRRETRSGKQHRPQILMAPGDPAPSVEDTLCRGLLDVGRSSRLVTVHAWEPLSAFVRAGFTPLPEGGQTFFVSLDRSEADLMKALHRNRRSHIRKATESGVEVTERLEPRDMDRLVEVFAETHRRLELPVRSRAQLEELIALSRNRKVLVARREGEIIGATFVRFQRGGLAEYSENASLAEARPYHPNEALMWAAIAWSRSQGCQAYSFGGANRFKDGFGGTILPTYGFRLDQTPFRLLDKRDDLVRRARRIAKSILRGEGQPAALRGLVARADALRLRFRRGGGPPK